ncbi:MAG: ABC transporter substrate-binding protein [Burkholderiales bacterium]|nr:ABC transporter substrate-binding protein [Burkholderiales bacterium]GIK86092.1 MAG: sugar ABC transporter substrate-binding protein [Betaproteobacteria bacterium]
MKTWKILLTAALGTAFAATAWAQQTTLRIFTGGQQRPDVMRKIADEYQKRNPNVKIEIEVGGATSEAQQQYLSTVLSSKDSVLDVVLIDVIRPAQWAAQGWAEPLDGYLGADRQKVMGQYLKAYVDANTVGGKIISLPYFADAQFMYYRKDLLEKYKRPVPRTWDEMMETARVIMEGEKNPNLQGFSTAGAPIEGTVCTYLVPLWGMGSDLTRGGKLNLDTPQARQPFQLYGRMKQAGVLPRNIAEIPTDRIRIDMQAGNLIFAQSWGYVWNRLENDADSKVKGKIGVARLPHDQGGQSATCIGGWQLAVSAFSKNKQEAVKFVRYLSSPEVSEMQAVMASHLPVFPSVYKDPDVLKANPWFAEALPVVESARSRPVSHQYPQVSDAIRSNMNAYLAGTKTTDTALADMKSRLQPIFR